VLLAGQVIAVPPLPNSPMPTATATDPAGGAATAGASPAPPNTAS
jgi:hypothetical protein